LLPAIAAGSRLRQAAPFLKDSRAQSGIHYFVLKRRTTALKGLKGYNVKKVQLRRLATGRVRPTPNTAAITAGDQSSR